jgi:hypothetical protein
MEAPDCIEEFALLSPQRDYTNNKYMRMRYNVSLILSFRCSFLCDVNRRVRLRNRMEISQTFWAPFAALSIAHTKIICIRKYERMKRKCGGGYGKFTHKSEEKMLSGREDENERRERECCQGYLAYSFPSFRVNLNRACASTRF